jgi:arsenate reductase
MTMEKPKQDAGESSPGIRILFISRRNSGRSQMAEAFLRRLHPDRFEVESAGLEPAQGVNPLVIRVMEEAGFDLSGKRTRSVSEILQQGRIFDHTITLCRENGRECPAFPGVVKHWRWPFPDPGQVVGSSKEQLDQVRKIRDAIRAWIVNNLERQPEFSAAPPKKRKPPGKKTRG